MSRAEDTRFDSWKEISGYLRVDIRTARRWAQERGLPVHRIPGEGRRAVYAYASEIDEWLRSDNRPRPDLSESGLSPGDVATSAERSRSGTRLNGASDVGLTLNSSRWTRNDPAFRIAMLALAVLVVGLALRLSSSGIAEVFARLLPGFVTHSSQVTRIDSVSPIHAEAIQTIVIRGQGFGPRPGTIRMNSEGGVDTLAGSNQTSLVIANLGDGMHRWTAGRASEVNACEISVRLESWSDSQIVLSGFSGPIGSRCGEKYQIVAGDRLEFGVFGPLNQCGPGGIPNCPGEVRNGHIGLIQAEVLPSTTAERSCR
ncbi:MAG: helix-turn-helix domain-containing protein [Candidatus Acidiferrales bacterium]